MATEHTTSGVGGAGGGGEVRIEMGKPPLTVPDPYAKAMASIKAAGDSLSQARQIADALTQARAGDAARQAKVDLIAGWALGFFCGAVAGLALYLGLRDCPWPTYSMLVGGAVGARIGHLLTDWLA